MSRRISADDYLANRAAALLRISAAESRTAQAADSSPTTAVHAEAAQLLTGLADAARDRAAFLATINTGSSDQAATLNAQVAARIQKLADGETAHAGGAK